jgi:large subunit ribosomal protein L9
MKIILIKDVRKVGKKYDVKDVADGFALNSLIPNKEAIPATPENVKRVETMKKKESDFKRVDEEILRKNLAAIRETILEISGKTNDIGHLFAGIHKEQLAVELKKQAHIDILPEYILLEKNLKEVGEHEVEVEAQGVKVKFKVVVKGLEK